MPKPNPTGSNRSDKALKSGNGLRILGIFSALVALSTLISSQVETLVSSPRNPRSRLLLFRDTDLSTNDLDTYFEPYFDRLGRVETQSIATVQSEQSLPLTSDEHKLFDDKINTMFGQGVDRPIYTQPVGHLYVHHIASADSSSQPTTPSVVQTSTTEQTQHQGQQQQDPIVETQQEVLSVDQPGQTSGADVKTSISIQQEAVQQPIQETAESTSLSAQDPTPATTPEDQTVEIKQPADVPVQDSTPATTPENHPTENQQPADASVQDSTPATTPENHPIDSQQGADVSVQDPNTVTTPENHPTENQQAADVSVQDSTPATTPENHPTENQQGADVSIQDLNPATPENHSFIAQHPADVACPEGTSNCHSNPAAIAVTDTEQLAIVPLVELVEPGQVQQNLTQFQTGPDTLLASGDEPENVPQLQELQAGSDVQSSGAVQVEDRTADVLLTELNDESDAQPRGGDEWALVPHGTTA